MVRIALVGYGGMGRVHHESYKKVGDAEVVAICDCSVDFTAINADAPAINISTAAATDSADETISYYKDMGDLLSRGGFDAVDICLPTFLHASASIRFLDAGYPVISEKPMALDFDSARNMIVSAKSSGKILSVAQCLRFWPEYVEIKRLIDTGEYGSVQYATFARYGDVPKWSWNGWMKREDQSGGALLDLHIHDTDMVQHLFGMPEAVVSAGNETAGAGIYHVDTLYRYPDKVVHGSGGWSASSSYGFRMMGTVSLEGATLELNFAAPNVLTIHPEGGESFSPELGDGDGYFHEIADFVGAVDTGVQSGVITPESAAESVRICLAEAQSVREKREVSIL